MIVAEEDGVVEFVDGFKIVIAAKTNPLNKKTYVLKKFLAFQRRHLHQSNPALQCG